MVQFYVTKLTVAQVTIKPQSWDSSPHGVSENLARSISHTSDTWTSTMTPGFNSVHIVVNVLYPIAAITTV